ncbi:MCE family protein [Mycolicibacterium sphagni]|uniref:Mammalian cell entry protein n=1 Tax=Mycolicibacterium sphagni TaxID=1786 RepID=A0A255DRR8_9MYCO|nr:MCE family protein [Mycolicibacterium sphagni]OYN82149.1 mammalian cell entry protein [Mycolicibacterium sphagni]
MSRHTAISLKFGVFAIVMITFTGLLFLAFGQFRSGATNSYSAVFADASRLKSGDAVRASGIRVGTVTAVAAAGEDRVLVTFDADRSVALTSGTAAAVRYLNLVGDRYLELVDGPGSTRLLPPGSQIPLERTTPALDLDLLLGGLKPVIQGLNPQDINALTASLLQIFQGQGDTMASLLSKTSSFTTALADNGTLIQQVIDNLNTVVGTLDQNSGQFSATLDRLERLISELSTQREPVGEAIDALDRGTASLTDLLGQSRIPLKGTVDQLARLAPLLESDKGRLDTALQKAPENYRKLIRLGAYGSFVNYYICGIQLRVSDLQGRTAVFPWFKQDQGRCAEP